METIVDTELQQDILHKPNPQSVFDTTVSGTMLWHYGDQKTHITNLYELAKRKSWNVTADINWDHFSRLRNFPMHEVANPLRGYYRYEALPEPEQKRLAWMQHCLEISEILHGEQGALIIASQLVSSMQTVEAKLFASSQVFDEARHVEFFSRYLADIGGRVYPPSAELRFLIEQTINDSRWDMKFIACQVLIESLAMARFQEIKRSTIVPSLREAIEQIAKDEARHVRFGTEMLKVHLMSLSEEELELRGQFVVDSMLKLANSQNMDVQIAQSAGWEVPELRYHLRRYRLAHPEIARDRLRVLLLNLDCVGLLTRGVRQRIATCSAGLSDFQADEAPR